MKEKSGLIKIWLAFMVFIVLFMINFRIKPSIGYTAMMWLILEVLMLIISITSAMIAHGVVDIIRFSFFGLPF